MKNFHKLADKFKNLDKQKKIYFIVFILITFIMTWAFVSAKIITTNFNREQVSGKADEQKVSANGIIITETKNSAKYFEIYGENGSYNNNDKIATLYNVVGNFYKDNEISMSFQSSKGQYDENNNQIILFENTYIVLKDNTSLLTDKLTWSGSDEDTIAEGNVKIKRGNEFYATADKCIIFAGYDKFKIVGKSQSKIFENEENK
ncbi:LPS export ABC transporter periplasmic protein LptC [bacterium]|nr:LPS export ABC transporter periplasmic protein LptC [bacterium]